MVEQVAHVGRDVRAVRHQRVDVLNQLDLCHVVVEPTDDRRALDQIDERRAEDLLPADRAERDRGRAPDGGGPARNTLAWGPQIPSPGAANIPEPSTLPLVGLGGIWLAVARRRSRPRR